MNELLSKVEKYLLYTTVFLFPITVLPISPNPFVVPKLAVLSFGIALLLLIRSLRIIFSGKLDFSVGNFDFPVLLIAIAFLLSAILRTPNKMEAFLLPGTATTIVVAALLYFLINQLKENEKTNLSMTLFGSASVFSVLTLLAFSGIFAKIPQLPAYLKISGFTPEGGYLPSAIFLGVVLPIAIGHLLSEKNSSRKIFFGVSIAIIVFALGASIFNILPGRPSTPRFPSYGVSWFIAVDALKESPVFGVGPGNYITAFNRYRPLSYNLTDLWAIKFATARSFYLTALTEAGMLAAAGVVLLFLTLYRTARRDFKEKKLVNWGFAASSSLISLLVLVVILLLAPATILLIVLLFVLLALNAKTRHTTLSLTTQATESQQGASTQMVTSRFPALLVTVPVIIITILFGLRATRVLSAEYKFKKALDYLAANDANKTYDTMREAIRGNPTVDRYHATFARVNLALANAIAQKAAGPERPGGVEGQQPTQITDQDRQNITLLIQQAINEGKATVSLNPLRSGNWEVLAQIYRAIMPLAKGADTFSVQTYRQAVALDPFNPNMRIALGGIHYTLRDYEGAIRVFESAVAAKQNHANAHYNLSFALRDAGNLDRALSEMSLAVSLLDPKTPDYELARKALVDLQAKKQEAAAKGTELTPPQGEQGPSLEPPVELPEGSQPPEAVITPTPSTAEEESTGDTTSTPTPTQIP